MTRCVSASTSPSESSSALSRDLSSPLGPFAPWEGLRIPRPLFLVAGLWLLLVMTGCTTARDRTEPTNLLGNLRYRNLESENLFKTTFRSGNLYQDFRPAVIVDAIFQDEHYRRLFLETLRERYFLTESDMATMGQAQQQQFDTGFEFLLLVYGGSNKPVKLDYEDSNWQVLLRDDEGDLLRPSEIQLIKEDSLLYRYVDLHFIGLDRWSRLYVVQFPKLEKTITDGEIGEFLFEMFVTGLEGTVTMSWDDTSLFYRASQKETPLVPAVSESQENVPSANP